MPKEQKLLKILESIKNRNLLIPGNMRGTEINSADQQGEGKAIHQQVPWPAENLL